MMWPRSSLVFSLSSGLLLRDFVSFWAELDKSKITLMQATGAYSSYRSMHGRPKAVRGRPSSFRLPGPLHLRAPQHLTNCKLKCLRINRE
jgi:hypothetical protein